MKFLDGIRGIGGRRPHAGRTAAWALCVLLFVVLAPDAKAQATPAGTQITNSAQVTYETANNGTYTVVSNTVVLIVGQVAGVDLEPPRSSLTNPGSTVVFDHTVTNAGNGTDACVITAASHMGWPVRVYHDANGNGTLDASDPQLTAGLTLDAGETASLLVAVDVPGIATVRGIVDTIDVETVSEFDSTASDTVRDMLTVQDAGILITLTKRVDRPSATTGDVLNYTITYAGSGSGSATDLEIRDPLPMGTSYVPGTMRWNDAPQTDGSADDAASLDLASNSVVFRINSVDGATTGTASFAVTAATAQGDGQTVIANTASATYVTAVGTDSVVSNIIETTLVYPQVFLEKALLGPNSAHIGDDVGYTIRYGNSSATVTARDVVVSDTLPTGLAFVASLPAADVNGQTLTWNLGDVPPGAAATIDLTTRVTYDRLDTLSVRNMAVMDAVNAPADTATAAAVALVNGNSVALTLDKSANALEVGLGETVPFTLRIENAGLIPLSDVRIHDRLPSGGRYVNGSATGADSVHAAGRDLVFFIPGPLAAGASHTLRYAVAIVSADQDVLQNTAYASAEDGAVRSADAIAWVRVRPNLPMETRAAIGKVWVDLDGDGVQGSGEPGVAGVDVWTDDGEIVTTDSEGRFSFRNLRTGRHAFRIDRSTLPSTYGIDDQDPGADLETLESSGWTTPHINFRLVPRVGQISEVRVPLAWSFAAENLCTAIRDSAERANAGRFELRRVQPRLVSFDVAAPQLVLSGVTFEPAKADLDGESHAVLDRVAATLTEHPDVNIQISGHTDSTGTREVNIELAIARANAVMAYLASEGVDTARMTTRGFGPDRPAATNDTPEGRQQNRRVELDVVEEERGDADVEALRAALENIGMEETGAARPDPLGAQQAAADPCASRARIQYELVLENDYAAELSGLALRFAPQADSAVVLIGDSVIVTTGASRITLPTVPAATHLTVRAWSDGEAESAAATLELPDGQTERMSAAVHNPLERVRGVTASSIAIDALPDPRTLPAGAAVGLVVAPPRGRSSDMIYVLAAGWEYQAGSSVLDGAPVADPQTRRDKTGANVLIWGLGEAARDRLTFRLHPAGVDAAPDSVTVAPLRTPEERQAEHKRAFIAGPAVEIFAPIDGTVFSSDRVFIGVRGEPRAPVTLFDGESEIGAARVRLDGVHDFIAVELPPGPHRLRIRMVNSWGQERWDSAAVHVIGLPASFDPDRSRVSLVADGQTTERVTVRAVDQWGVPVINRPYVTLRAEGIELRNADEDASSVGIQVRPDHAGWMVLELRAGRAVGSGAVELRAGDATTRIALEMLPAIRPLMVTGVGRVGIGASPDAFGAITARGRLDERTSLILSYDSRHLDAGRDVFGRSSDPLEHAQYPILGDAGQQRTASASRYAFSARVERGFDWFALGDVMTNGFASDLTLTNYRRALPGAAARVTTGPVVWHGFGSSTSQNVRQQQLRGAGVSGPYELERGIQAGTERIVIETRALENPERILAQQVLIRFVDYQIDYESGALLLKRPIPASDTYGNPMFLAVTYEASSGGPSHAVWGLRATADVLGIVDGALGADSLLVGTTWIREGRVDGTYHLTGMDVRLLKLGGFKVGAEVSHSQSPDSSGFATAVDASLDVMPGVNLSAGWMKIGAEFQNPSRVGLRGGTEEIKLGGQFQVGTGQVRIQHERQTFDVEGITRERTSGGVVQPVGSSMRIETGVSSDRFDAGSGSSGSQAGEVKVTWQAMPSLDLWTEARHQFSYDGLVARPDHLGLGASFEVGAGVSLEAQHRQVFMPGDGQNYAITSIGMRTSLGFGTEAWGSYQLAGVDGAYNAAVVGLNNRIRLGKDWTVNGLLERRVGLGNAPDADPVRALPYLQQDEDYWSVGVGAELLPSDAPYRASARGEFRDGDVRSTRLFSLAGDVSVNSSLALLSRQEYLQSEQTLPAGKLFSRRLSSLWGVAFRPVHDDRLNVLAKFEWLDAVNPAGGGVLTSRGDEGRLILATEAIWNPFETGEFAARYAVRRATGTLLHEDGVEQTLRSFADFIGWRMGLEAKPWLGFRTEGRLLIERTSGTQRFDVAPQIVALPVAGLEVATGYRFGDLRDPDFAVSGGHGFFVTLGVRITEQAFRSAADFWRPRFGQSR